MAKLDQRGFDNQRSGRDWLTAREAASRLGVKLATLYAYTSRGLVRSVPRPRGKGRHYAAEDVARLKLKSAARAGHAAVASGALLWGEPVLDSSITRIDERGPVYRGHAAIDLAADGVPFEAVAELLWTGQLSRDARWPDALRASTAEPLRGSVAGAPTLLAALSVVAATLELGSPARFELPEPTEHARARALIAALARAVVLRLGGPWRVAGDGVAELLAAGLGARRSSAGRAAIDQALIVCADHELNVSAFAARVVASTGAELYASIAAALSALSGPRHGGTCDRVDALLAETPAPERAAGVIARRAARGEAVPGFGHPLYPGGDPRAAALLATASELGGDRPRVRRLLALARAMQRAGHEPPTLDFALVALSEACGLPTGSAAALFALGRSAGWVAHVLEQRRTPRLLRPRARYVEAQK